MRHFHEHDPAPMIYRFDEFELDVGLFQLRRAGKVRELGQTGFDLLHYMLRHAGSPVTRNELSAHIWRDSHVGESTLAVHVRTIRKALGESSALIQTVRGLGYQITCPVELVVGSHAGPSGARAMQRRPPKQDPLGAVERMNGLLYLALLLAEPLEG